MQPNVIPAAGVGKSFDGGRRAMRERARVTRSVPVVIVRTTPDGTVGRDLLATIVATPLS
jgi:hypothetical protein